MKKSIARFVKIEERSVRADRASRCAREARDDRGIGGGTSAPRRSLVVAPTRVERATRSRTAAEMAMDRGRRS